MEENSKTMMKLAVIGLVFALTLAFSVTASAYRPLIMQTIPKASDRSLSSSGSNYVSVTGDSYGLRSKHVRIDVDALKDIQVGDEVDLELDGRIVTAVTDRIEKSEDGSKITWSGKIRASSDMPISIFVITVLDGFISGAFESGNTTYEVVAGREKGEGILVDHTYSVPIEDGDAIVPEERPNSSNLFNRFVPSKSGIRLADEAQAVGDSAGQTTQYIDILALYTPDLLQRYGGEAQLKTQIENTVNYANTVLKNSNINAVIRVVGYRSVTVANSTDMNGLLYDMYYGRGAFADILKWMDEVGADQATLFIPFQFPRTPYCGIAFQPTSADTYTNTSQYYADYRKSIFRTVVALGSSVYNGYTYTCDYPTFIHELGHNLGAAHDKAHNSVTPFLPYGYGYCGPTYGTIMAYCWPRVPYFSENRSVNGTIIGNAQAENAKVLRFTAPYMAATRQSPSNGGGGNNNNNNSNNNSTQFKVDIKVIKTDGGTFPAGTGAILRVLNAATGYFVTSVKTDSNGIGSVMLQKGQRYLIYVYSYPLPTSRYTVSPSRVYVDENNTSAVFNIVPRRTNVRAGQDLANWMHNLAN
ncbi:MAG: M12 family metallo-peptidase [Thermodesulforhabdaceae bacterium]